MAQDTVKARVGRGAKLLDEKVLNWRKRIDLGKLDIRCPHMCILGQLGGNFIEGLRLVGLRPYESYDYGFNVYVDDENKALKGVCRSFLAWNNN